MTNGTYIGKTPWGTERWAYKTEDIKKMTEDLDRIWKKKVEKKGRGRR